jgi:hypothetical protein
MRSIVSRVLEKLATVRVVMLDPEHESKVLFPLEKGCVRMQVRQRLVLSSRV